MEMFDALWAIADKRGWTDNTLLHKLIDVLENVPREQQEQIITAVKDEDEDEPEFVEITDAHIEHMRLWSGEPNLSILEMMKSVEFLQEILRITKKEQDDD
jgi:hypothetical protein